ncbi:hypothetical protein BZA77DRAFT_354111 [Pyronema omphalodes]|nr:hypothetical protein BZA77DRAFT_354111 [Pyronema omphalodes]
MDSERSAYKVDCLSKTRKYTLVNPPKALKRALSLLPAKSINQLWYIAGIKKLIHGQPETVFRFLTALKPEAGLKYRGLEGFK